MHYRSVEVPGACSDMQDPIHVTPNLRNMDTFSGTSGSLFDLSMAGISQQTLAMNAHMRHATAPGDDVDQAESLSRAASLYPRAAVADAGADGAASEQSMQEQQLQANAILRANMEFLQYIALQGAGSGGEGSVFQRTFEELSRLSSAAVAGNGVGEAAAASWPCAPAAMLDTWGWQEQAATDAAPMSAEEPYSNGQRVEELNKYIRQQAQEYYEGQAEWGRQMAEVRGESMRELEKVKREREEIERQAREGLLHLTRRLHDAGVSVGDEGGKDPSQDAADLLSRPVGSWASGVAMDEYQQVHRQRNSAEDRVRHLEQYIKDQSTNHLATVEALEARVQAREEEVRCLRQGLVRSSLDARQMADELQALKARHQQKVSRWEQGAQNLLGVLEQFLSTQPGVHHRDPEELESGRFGRTATKLSLTLPSEAEGNDIGSLRRLLKDVLKSQGVKEKGAKRPQPKPKNDDPDAFPGAVRSPAPGNAEATPASAASPSPRREAGSGGEGAEDTRAAAEARGGRSGHSAKCGRRCGSACDSSGPSTRETSPSRGALHIIGRNSVSTPDPSVQLVAHVACEMRQLLVASRQTDFFAPGARGPMRQLATGSPGSGSSSIGASSSPSSCGAAGPQERRRIQQCIDGMPPARQAIAQGIMAAEKMLRGLDQELRRRCEELLGQEQLLDCDGQGVEGRDEAAGSSCLVELEARMRLPLAEDSQLLSLMSLRHIQRQLAAALTEFLSLPQKLKTVFDLTKKLTGEVASLLPPALAQLPEHGSSPPAGGPQ